MATTNDGRWSISVGPHGAKVRAREHPKKGGNVYLFSWDPELGGNRKESLKFKVRDSDGKLIEENVKAAKDAAAELSNKLIRGEAPKERDPTTLGEAVDIFLREEVDGMTGRHSKGTRRDVKLIETYFGRGFELAGFARRDWNALKRDRESGRIDAHGEPVETERRRKRSARTVQKTLKVLRQLYRFSVNWRRGDGSYLLDRDPTAGMELPKVKDPNRPGCSDELLAALLEKAPAVKMRTANKDGKRTLERSYLREMIQVAAGTGHRIGALVRLRWSDWEPDRGANGVLTWRGEDQKDGKTRQTAVPPSVREALEAQRQRFPDILPDGAYIFPAPASDGHVRVDVALSWLHEAEAEIRDHVKGWGWHAFRRRWTDKMKSQDPVDVSHLGGWSNPATMQAVYQSTNVEDTERVYAAAGDPGRVAVESGS